MKSVSRRPRGPNPEIVSELKRLALRYGILTEYTSYLVQEPNVLARPMPLQPPAPEAQAGAGAVQRSREARKLAGSLSLDATVTTRSESPCAKSVPADGPIAPTDPLGAIGPSAGTDIAHGDSLRVVTVAAFSDA